MQRTLAGLLAAFAGERMRRGPFEEFNVVESRPPTGVGEGRSRRQQLPQPQTENIRRLPRRLPYVARATR